MKIHIVHHTHSPFVQAVQVFGPSGFQEMLDAGMQLTLYSFFWATPQEGTTFTQYEWVSSPHLNDFIGGPIARIAPQDSYTFYTEIMRRCVLWNCIGFEHDFLDFAYLAMPDSAVQPGVYEGFMEGLSQAAVDYGVPVQLCMPLPSDVLLSTLLPAVSNIRASDDNDYTYAGPNRWRIGLTSMLHGAVNIRPFFDGTWTHSAYGNTHDVPYPANYVQNSTELDLAISTLSSGPVGLGDMAGYTNITLTMCSCSANGVLLKPSLPAAPLDLYFMPDPQQQYTLQGSGTELWQAPSFVQIVSYDTHDDRLRYKHDSAGLDRYLSKSHLAPSNDTFPSFTPCPFMSLLAIDAVGATVFPGDFTPSLSVTVGASACAASGLATGYVALPWSRGLDQLNSSCAEGSPASQCVVSVTDEAGINITTGINEDTQYAKGSQHPFDILSLSPVLNNGYALLGELFKFVRVSPVRFSSVSTTPLPSLQVTVLGSSGESVDVLVLVPGGIVRRISVQFGEGAQAAALQCEGTGNQAQCSVLF